MLNRHILAFAILVFTSQLWAHSPSEDGILPKESEELVSYYQKLLFNQPVEYYNKTQAVFRHFGVPAEGDAADFIQRLHGQTNLQTARARLSHFDLKNMFSRLFNLDNRQLTAYQDLDQKRVEDFAVNLKLASPQAVLTQGLPLSGLRIAIDPGHMGGDFWDQETGKMVRDSRGRVVSEGTTALQVAILLRTRLQEMGATVLLTREGQHPVSTLSYREFDIRPYALAELRDSAHQAWFLQLLTNHPIGSGLYRAFENHANFKKLFSNSSRHMYFIRRADLSARAEMINAFQPHLTLVIHFDIAPDEAGRTGLNPKAPNASRVYVQGNYEATEFASRAQRAYFARGLLDHNMWTNTLNYSKDLITAMTRTLGTRPMSGSPAPIVIAPGVHARNLYLSRLLNHGAVAYLEVLYFNRPEEFEALHHRPNNMIIDGRNVPYSNRTKQVADSLFDATLAFSRR